MTLRNLDDVLIRIHCNVAIAYTTPRVCTPAVICVIASMKLLQTLRRRKQQSAALSTQVERLSHCRPYLTRASMRHCDTSAFGCLQAGWEYSPADVLDQIFANLIGDQQWKLRNLRRSWATAARARAAIQIRISTDSGDVRVNLLTLKQLQPKFPKADFKLQLKQPLLSGQCLQLLTSMTWMVCDYITLQVGALQCLVFVCHSTAAVCPMLLCINSVL